MTICRYTPLPGTDRAPDAMEGIPWRILELSLLVNFASKNVGVAADRTTAAPTVSTDYVRRREPSFLIALKVFFKAVDNSSGPTIGNDLNQLACEVSRVS